MILGIVGCEAAKFTVETEILARLVIRRAIGLTMATFPGIRVVSGACHLGGIDIWAIEEAKDFGVETQEFPPAMQSWTNGYRLRNIQIAQQSDKVICITVKVLPAGYAGMRFERCYHCNTLDHVKSGGCWTVKYARTIGKAGEVIAV
ncbi:hypothetical protein LCGC14_1895230 [marine sediment metagenome]|uniref:Uncharacterized protein n=1 Tax=marine sediment metagenome TaxID=412755 RepID=A0A0F9FYJ7_9ZZZZ